MQLGQPQLQAAKELLVPPEQVTDTTGGRGCCQQSMAWSHSNKSPPGAAGTPWAKDEVQKEEAPSMMHSKVGTAQ